MILLKASATILKTQYEPYGHLWLFAVVSNHFVLLPLIFQNNVRKNTDDIHRKSLNELGIPSDTFSSSFGSILRIICICNLLLISHMTLLKVSSNIRKTQNDPNGHFWQFVVLTILTILNYFIWFSKNTSGKTLKVSVWSPSRWYRKKEGKRPLLFWS